MALAADEVDRRADARDAPSVRNVSGELPEAIAVYGTLRRGQRNHGLLAGAQFLGTGFVIGALFDVPRTPFRAYAYLYHGAREELGDPIATGDWLAS